MADIDQLAPKDHLLHKVEKVILKRKITGGKVVPLAGDGG